MLSSAKIGTGSWRYYTAEVACAATDYYIGAGEAPGRWTGRGLPELGLEPGAVVSEAQLEALFARALNPTTGQRLGREWRIDGVTGFDLTFSAPKSVSSLWALADPGTAGELRTAHTAAVEAALSYLDAHASWSRRGVDGTQQIASAGLVAALFEHRTSRCADPQLHTHALVVNKVRCADGVWRTLDATELFHHKKSAGMIYQAALRSEILARTELIFGTPDINGQAEILGVPDGLLKLWSKRTTQIAPEASAKIAEYENSLGRSLTAGERAAVTKAAVLKTRPGKTGADAGSLRDQWIAEAHRSGFDAGTVAELARQAGPQAAGQSLGKDRTVARAEVGAGAVKAAAGLRATISCADVTGQVAARLPVDGRRAAEVVQLIEQITDQALGVGAGSGGAAGCPDAVTVGEHPHGRTRRASDARWAGAKVLAAEARVLSLAARGRRAGYGRVPAAGVTRALDSVVDSGVDSAGAAAVLDPSQQSAVRHLLEGGDFVAVLTAPAGAGKTATLGAATAAWQAAGFRVIGLAPSARAAAELASATGGRADTLAKWVHDHARRGLLPRDLYARVALDAATVVVVDEASMANTHDLDTLITAAARAAAKVVLVGDPAQIGVVNGPGGMLAALAAAGHGVELGGVHRFAEPWEREATLALRRGNPDVLTDYQDHGRIHPCPTGEDAVAAVHAHWLDEKTAGREVLMMARTRADVEALNTRARSTGIADGHIHGPVMRMGERDWQAGDLVRTRRNDRNLLVGQRDDEGHVRNGDRFRVLTVSQVGSQDGLLVEDLTGRGRVRLPAAYVSAHAEYGWAATIDGAQGATVDVGIVLVRPGLDREHLYVAMTRGRHGNHAYIAPGPAEAADHHHVGPVARSGIRPAAAPGAHNAALGADERAREVLLSALARTGAQDAAHTLRESARARAVEEHRRAADQAADRAWTGTTGGTIEPGTPAEHAATTARLQQRRDELARLRRDEDDQRRQLQRAEDELASTSRWSRSRRHDLQAHIETCRGELRATISAQHQLGAEVDELRRQADQQSRQRSEQRETGPRQGEERTRPRGAWRTEADPTEAPLAPARPVTPALARARTSARTVLTRREAEELRQAARPRRDRYRSGPTRRDDGPGLGR